MNFLRLQTFRDIGYSLFLDSVQRHPDETDRSKVRVSGKMIVDGICIQFLGCFDCRPPTQQISGVGRVQLDENYYRELSSNSSDPTKEEGTAPVPPVIMSKTFRTSMTKSKTHKKPVTRSQTISEDLLTKSSTRTSSSSSSFVAEPAVPSINEYSRLLSHYQSPQSSIPIAIPSATPTGFLPFNHSQSLPAYVLPGNPHIAYIANPTNADLSSINPGVFFLANPHHPQIHFLTPIPLTNSAFHPCNILPSKRPDQEANPSPTPNPNDRLPLKKRARYNDETNRPDGTK